MGRRHIYYCDNCKKDFGNLIHLNVKNGQIGISYPQSPDEKDPTKSIWNQKMVGCDGNEKHFCNGKCLGEYIDKKVSNLIERAHLAMQIAKTEGEQ